MLQETPAAHIWNPGFVDSLSKAVDLMSTHGQPLMPLTWWVFAWESSPS